MKIIALLMVFTICFLACQDKMKDELDPIQVNPLDPRVNSFIKGADLSYVNEMADCDATYFDSENKAKSAFEIFGEARTELARFRLWHSPDWTKYSTFTDIKKSIASAKSAGMIALLDFHYSDDWADPAKQIIPAAWMGVADDQEALVDSVYNYTYKVLDDLALAGLLPEMVQIGNETNIEILQDPNQNYNNINWSRNVALLNSGIKAARDIADLHQESINIMLHIAQPENAIWWFEQAHNNNILDYDWIGISYYPLWSEYDLNQLTIAIKEMTSAYGKRLMIAETAYPWTLENKDAAPNILGEEAMVNDIPFTTQGQLDYLEQLEESVIAGGGEGIIYWEPAWVSTGCSTRWATGSSWENAAQFGHSNKALHSMQWYKD